MKIAVLKELRPFESRVAATPDTVRKLIALGASVTVETGAGQGAALTDEDYLKAGAEVAANPAATAKGAEIFLKVQRPLTMGEEVLGEDGALTRSTIDETKLIGKGAILIGLLAPYGGGHVAAYAEHGITSFAMEFVPRITRAQTMDVLSSQANLAGYRAVLDAAAYFGHAFSDDDDRGGDDSAGEAFGDGGRGCWAPGDCDRAQAGGGCQCDRCSLGDPGAGQVARG